MPVVVALPGEIDTNNASEILTLIIAAVVPGVSVIIADLTATSFCDSAGLRHLLLAYRQTTAAGAQLRLAIAPHGPIGRVVQLTGIDRHVPVYPTLQLASDGGPPPSR